MTIDSNGFVHAIDRSKIDTSFFANQQIYYRINTLLKTNIRNIRNIRARNNCWICEGWRELKFTYKPPNNIENPQDLDVKIHLNFENYVEYDTNWTKTEFQIYRMCPPGTVLFYFTINKQPATSYGSITTELHEPLIFVSLVKVIELDSRSGR
jgi:hypothetical protein